jgi:hypothetical protein
MINAAAELMTGVRPSAGHDVIHDQAGGIQMKLKLLATAAVAIAISAPLADAASVKTTHKHYVRAPRHVVSPETPYGPNDPYAVWVAGTYVGRDPDPRVRNMMIREFYHGLGNR